MRAKQLNRSIIVDLKDDDWLEKQRYSGKVVAQSLAMLKDFVDNKTTKSLLELDAEIERFILSKSCIPTFKGYKGFPKSVCMSVNNQLVHGIPNEHVLKEGDIVTFDLGATNNGVIADAAITCIYGEPKSSRHVDLINATKQSLMDAINSIKIGKRLGCIGEAIHNCAKKNNFSVIVPYGGHGISISKDGVGIPHADPFVSNKSSSDEGVRFQPGMTIAIEPLMCIGNPITKLDRDGWTVCTNDMSAHFEHTIFIHENRVEILTDLN
jgi:methionyl aminopeptidase